MGVLVGVDVVPDRVATATEPGFGSKRFWREEEQSEPEDLNRRSRGKQEEQR